MHQIFNCSYFTILCFFWSALDCCQQFLIKIWPWVFSIQSENIWYFMVQFEFIHPFFIFSCCNIQNLFALSAFFWRFWMHRTSFNFLLLSWIWKVQICFDRVHNLQVFLLSTQPWLINRGMCLNLRKMRSPLITHY